MCLKKETKISWNYVKSLYGGAAGNVHLSLFSSMLNCFSFMLTILKCFWVISEMEASLPLKRSHPLGSMQSFSSLFTKGHLFRCHLSFKILRWAPNGQRQQLRSKVNSMYEAAELLHCIKQSHFIPCMPSDNCPLFNGGSGNVMSQIIHRWFASKVKIALSYWAATPHLFCINLWPHFQKTQTFQWKGIFHHRV